MRKRSLLSVLMVVIICLSITGCGGRKHLDAISADATKVDNAIQDYINRKIDIDTLKAIAQTVSEDIDAINNDNLEHNDTIDVIDFYSALADVYGTMAEENINGYNETKWKECMKKFKKLEN